MEHIDSITPAPISGEYLDKSNLIETKTYELLSNNIKYQLKIEEYSSNILFFSIRPKEKITNLSYDKIFEYEEIVKILLLETNYYNNINKVFKFCDTALERGKVIINYEKDRKRFKFCLKKQMDFEEVECSFYLDEKNISNQDMIMILSEEINNLKIQNNAKNLEINNISDNIDNNNKINDNNNYNILDEKIKKLEEKNELLEAKFDSILDENTNLRKIISELQTTIKNLENKISKNNNEQLESSKENKKNEISINRTNVENEKHLKIAYKECITTSHSDSGFLRQFVVYKSIIDNFDYLVYNNKSNFNLDIIRIIDKRIVHSLMGHNAKVSVIKYYLRENSKGVLLSCDENRMAICWDLNGYKQIFQIKLNFTGYIWDATLLFNILGKYNLCIFPSNNINEYTQIYNFDNCSFVKSIYGSNNKTNYLIPWISFNNYYLIECCNTKISINNIFKNEKYADLEKSSNGLYCCGYLYKNIFLLVIDYSNSLLIIWNLISKTAIKEIKVNAYNCYGIMPLYDNFSIITCSEGLVLVDINSGEILTKTSHKKASNLCGIQKINSFDYGECVICSSNNNSIVLFNIKN